MYKHFIWKKWKETNYLYRIENGKGTVSKRQQLNQLLLLLLLLLLLSYIRGDIGRDLT